MGRLFVTRAIVGISLAAVTAGSGCAKGSDFAGTVNKTGGSGGSNGGAGAGGEGAAAGSADTGNGGTATTGNGGTGNGGTATTGNGGTGNGGTATTGNGGAAGDSSTTSSTGTGTTTSTTTTTDTGCGAGQHECGGQCFGNTPETGCLLSASCTPCSQPANGSSTCTAAGACDFTCVSPYVKQGGVCACGAACCTDSDCGSGQTCVGGTCMSSMTCDQTQCAALCVIQCTSMGKFGVGLCIGNTCNCTCM